MIGLRLEDLRDVQRRSRALRGAFVFSAPLTSGATTARITRTATFLCQTSRAPQKKNNSRVLARLNDAGLRDSTFSIARDEMTDVTSQRSRAPRKDNNSRVLARLDNPGQRDSCKTEMTGRTSLSHYELQPVSFRPRRVRPIPVLHPSPTPWIGLFCLVHVGRSPAC
ncbi:hypothetical protein EXIGLDRAFT_106351 [Exidia glandulosa HHB12029]|uniref:Uncharacterized protein n=1 Tax=Exidia glandulosa HHB12029 TaxID=1314781 RepID=A0A165GSF6_EXIGL|nr:hypothetical protein EXIGLDRAFT_106351 [Exidia glandulosa HHB12029]